MAKEQNAFNHPFFLTLIVLYAGTIGVGLTYFPPIRLPLVFTDFLLAAYFVYFIALTTVIYRHGAVTPNYGLALFLLECFIAVLFAWSFRLLFSAGEALACNKSATIQVVGYYLTHIILVLTTIPFRSLTSSQMSDPARKTAQTRYMLMLALSLIAVIAGTIVEFVALNRPALGATLTVTRRLIAGLMMAFVFMYFKSKPWERFTPHGQSRGSDLKPIS